MLDSSLPTGVGLGRSGCAATDASRTDLPWPATTAACASWATNRNCHRCRIGTAVSTRTNSRSQVASTGSGPGAPGQNALPASSSSSPTVAVDPGVPAIQSAAPGTDSTNPCGSITTRNRLPTNAIRCQLMCTGRNALTAISNCSSLGQPVSAVSNSTWPRWPRSSSPRTRTIRMSTSELPASSRPFTWKSNVWITVRR